MKIEGKRRMTHIDDSHHDRGSEQRVGRVSLSISVDSDALDEDSGVGSKSGERRKTQKSVSV